MARETFSGFTPYLTPAWAGDYFDREHVVPGGAKLDASQFNAEDAAVVIVGAAGAAANATSIPLKAPYPANSIPSGTLLYFGGSKKLARLTAQAIAGATSLTVEALPTALVENDTATYAGSGSKKKLVPAGTVVGRTLAERDASTGYGPAVATDDEIFILCLDVTDAARNPDADLYRHGSIVKENFLPNWSSLSADLQDAIRLLYTCVRGVN